ncbi:MAG: 2-C-methyl-D-erythritol 4-phosphate cytidylyltransferase [Clostridia bacterium]|nr:2-C-methyl-D-erythritol 4-phosphate cytidylyltransferase [Clostridia bacterium]
MVTAAILGAGKGLRLGSDTPKQFLSVGGEVILLRSLRAFTESGLCDRFYVLVPADAVDMTRGLIANASFPDNLRPRIRVMAGGESRGDTLLKLLEAMRADPGFEETVLLTHDAVRPFVTARMIADNIEAAGRYGACNTCVPAVDTVFLSADGRFIDSVPPRSTVFHAQTPQSFCAGELYRLIRSTPPEVYETLTDGCSVYTLHGRKVAMVQGSEDNIKITYAADLQKAELIAARRKETQT